MGRGGGRGMEGGEEEGRGWGGGSRQTKDQMKHSHSLAGRTGFEQTHVENKDL